MNWTPWLKVIWWLLILYIWGMLTYLLWAAFGPA